MTVDRRWRVTLRTVALGYLALLLVIPIGLVFYRTFEHGVMAVWDSVTTPAAKARCMKPYWRNSGMA